jgi:hypothetical protein
MARPRSRSRRRKSRRLKPTATTQRFGKATGLDVPVAKARKILSAYAAGMPITHIAASFGSSYHTVRAVIVNRRELQNDAESAIPRGASYLPPKTQLSQPKIVCPPADRRQFEGPIGPTFLADIFGYLRHADFSAQHAGVYFLFRDHKCVYVGRSECIAARCGQHLHGSGDSPKAFDRALYLPVAQHMLADVEAAAALALQPEYNKSKFRYPLINATQDQIQAQAQAA